MKPLTMCCAIAHQPERNLILARKRQDSKLPPYVYKAAHGYVWKPYLGKGVARPTRTIAPLTVTMSKLWRTYERLQADDMSGTLKRLLDTYVASSKFQTKAETTRTEQERQADKISEYSRGPDKTFGSAKLSSITPGVLTKYMDAREKDGAPKSANRELSLISAAWKWALARDLTTVPNPCGLVEKRSEQRRQHYADDSDYDRWIAYCKAAGPAYLWIVSEIAYLCRMRKVEVLTALKSQVLPEGFDTLRRKGSRDAITGWSDRLRAAIDACPTDEASRFSQYLITHNAKPIRVSSFNTMWQRRMRACVKETGITRFTLHDLKRKGATDSDEDATVSTGNTPGMSRTYDVSKLRAKPTK